MTTFAAYNEQAIWGVGNTEAEAFEDAYQWISKDSPHDFGIAPMTKALENKVARFGGNIIFGEIDGVLMTYAAYERVLFGASINH